jgi:hypothetical protein
MEVCFCRFPTNYELRLTIYGFSEFILNILDIPANSAFRGLSLPR